MVTAAQAYWLNRKRRQARNEGARGPQIALSASSQAENTSIGTTIGDLSVVGGTGTWTFTKTVDADSAFTLTTGALKNAIVFNYETKTSYSVTIQATNGTDTITRTFTISVTNVLEVTLNALTIDDQTAEPSVPWSATITGKTSGSTITATSSDGTVLSVVGTTVSGTFTSAGTPTVTLHETHPDATPRDTGIGITVADVEEIAAPTMVTVVEPITNPPSFVWNVQEVPPDEVQIGDVCHVRIDEDDGQVYDSDPIAAADENPSGFGVPPLSAGPHVFEFWYTRSGVVGAKSTPVEVEIISADPPVAVPVETGTLSNSGNTFTKTGAALGTAFASRRVIVAFGGTIGDTGRVFASATINGVTATLVQEHNNNQSYAAIIQAAVPSGSTGDIVINMTDSLFSSNRYSVYTVDDDDLDSTTPTSASGTVAGGTSVATGSSMGSSADGMLIAVVGFQSGASKGTFSAVTSNADAVTLDELTSNVLGIPFHANDLVGGSMTVTGSWTGSFNASIVAAAWR